MTENIPRIIVIGTSAGGMQALTMLLSRLPEDLPASILIVQHLSPDSSATFLVDRLNRYTELVCKVAEHELEFEPGTVYFSPPDKHLLVKGNKMLVVKGPRENQFRPAIDPLFRSAAAHHGGNAVGIILTGFMSDGVIGMECIKRSGGTTIVQHPNDAEFPALPENVLKKVDLDYVVPLSEMSEILEELTRQPAQQSLTIPADIRQEALIAERIMTNTTHTSIEELEKAGARSAYSCPDCGGGLWEMSQEGTMKRYRCHSGHAYSQDSLLLGMSNSLEETLWVALRTLEERRNILLNMSQGETVKGNHRWATMQEKRVEEMKVHIERLKELLSKSSAADSEHMGELG
ncbi:chemotaxis protein CheB [Pontibacter sp. HSC-36F09]|uniref:chemotaxis protein CheB n=1 Tax=Pontibacter sp. HSC-36F09 TaxID=2910966 RepID=UPI00209FBBF0|nr:chemotaxis protein CheB [Pontibacter sp. HSC-36F09]MCP2042327.1 two-component system chemotaxis response regulator CheB [Pontibacter sp. HSC-36F09]